MLLGKRPRPPIKRTTSMTGITVDITNVDSSPDGSDHHHHHHQNPHATVGPELAADSSSSANHHHHRDQNSLMMMVSFGNHDDQSFLRPMVSPRDYNQLQRERSNSNSKDFLETAPFLKTCGLCKRRLIPARDIYMYRGDTAFCSLDCREQQMKQDERKEKYAAAKNNNNNNNNNKEESHKNNAATAAASTSKKSQTVAAA